MTGDMLVTSLSGSVNRSHLGHSKAVILLNLFSHKYKKQLIPNRERTLSFTNCRLLMIFANSLDQDQAQNTVGSGLDPNRLTPS